jgi:serine/threonine protein kinase/tetratricopeptide (TPR) repeat protein/TolB-like protein
MAGQWEQVKEIVALALEQEPEQRTLFVRQACGDDDELRQEVESLLPYHDQADSLLEKPAALHLFDSRAAAMTDRRVGAYRITREIGHGGMAVVYLGERDDQEFRKRAAIKMLQPGIQSQEVLHRFRNERQTLASLDHPHIVRLLDGGSTEDGWPYLVMDYVEGVPIDEYCDAHGLAVRKRLELFLQVCAAVQYAHEHLVIHRDLKPGNILVTKEGVPRLLDFGIAKLLNPECLEEQVLTKTGWRPMTVEYASPEQVRGQAVGNASDVYSLGVLLYELLTGQRPFRAAASSRSEFERAVCEQEPERPSGVISKAGGSRTIEGDLDTIVLKAIRKEPEQRYASVREFAEDIERYLTGRPVLARDATLGYRSGRFLRRHKESLTTAMVVLAVMAGIGIWQFHRISGKGAASGPRRSVAILGFKNLSGRSETAWLSTAFSEMLATELAAGEQLRMVPRETVARTKIDLGLLDAESVPGSALERIRKNLGSGLVVVGSYLDGGATGGGRIRLDVRLQDTSTGETVAAASETGAEAQVTELASRTGMRLRERLGLSSISGVEAQQIQAALPSNPEAIHLYYQGLESLQAMDALAGRDLLERALAAEPSYPLAHAALATAWATLGYDANARVQAKQALDAAEKLSREDHLLVEARYYETVKNWQKAMEAYQVLVSYLPDSPEYALDLANAQSSGGKGKEALATLAALGRTDAAAKDDPRIDLGVSQAASSLGDSKLRRDAAERAAVKAERQGARLLVARARNLECRALANLGENERAKPVCEEARRIFAEAGDRAGLARALHAMAEVPLNQGDLVVAGNLYRQALAIMREIGYQQGVATESINLGVIAKKQGDFAAAHKLYSAAIQAYRQTGDKQGMAAAAGNLGNLLRAEGKLAEALAHYQRTLALSNELGDRSSTALALQAIGDVLADQGKLPGAHKMYQQALAIQQEIGEKSYYAATLVSIGEVFLQQADTDQARKLMEQALSLQEGLGEKGSAAETRLALAELACEAGRPKEAERLARSALQEFQKQKELDHGIWAAALLARSFLQEGNVVEAAQAIAKDVETGRAIQNLSVRLSVALDRAQMLMAANDLAGAERAARKVSAESSGSLVRLHLEAELVLGKIQMKRDVREGRKRLEDLARTAHTKGFELIARKASSLAA